MLAEDNTGGGFIGALGVLGNVGMYFAVSRHREPSLEREECSPVPVASSKADHIFTMSSNGRKQ